MKNELSFALTFGGVYSLVVGAFKLVAAGFIAGFGFAVLAFASFMAGYFLFKLVNKLRKASKEN